MKAIILLLNLLLTAARPPDEVTHACTNMDGSHVYLVKSPDDCYAGDKWVCDVGNAGDGTSVCCAWDYSTCALVDPPAHCSAVEHFICSAGL